MRYGLNNKNKRVEVTSKGQRAKCSDCGSILIAKFGEFKEKHWSHKSNNDCDSWHEPITEWHLSWQNLFPFECREVSLKRNNAIHRADIMLKNGMVIEIQNSPININDIEGRESFYGNKNMIWIINGNNLLKHSNVRYRFIKQEFSLTFSIPHYIDKYDELDNRFDDLVYDMDKFKVELFANEFLKELVNHESTINFIESNGNDFRFEFSTDKDFNQIKKYLYDLFDYTLNKFGINVNVRNPRSYEIFPKYNWDFDVKYLRISKDDYLSVYFDKKYWRKFIDKMKYPVFIDGLNGLEKDLIYWYQENKIIKKEQLVSKYLKYI